MAVLRIGLTSDERDELSERKSGKLWAKRVMADIVPLLGAVKGKGSKTGEKKMARGKTEYVAVKKARFEMLTKSGPFVLQSRVYFLGHAEELSNATKPDEPHRGKGLMVIETNVLGAGMEGMRKTAEFDVSEDSGWNEVNRLNAARLSDADSAKVLAEQSAVPATV